MTDMVITAVVDTETKTSTARDDCSFYSAGNKFELTGNSLKLT